MRTVIVVLHLPRHFRSSRGKHIRGGRSSRGRGGTEALEVEVVETLEAVVMLEAPTSEVKLFVFYVIILLFLEGLDTESIFYLEGGDGPFLLFTSVFTNGYDFNDIHVVVGC